MNLKENFMAYINLKELSESTKLLMTKEFYPFLFLVPFKNCMLFEIFF